MQYVYLLHAQMTKSYKIGMTTRPVTKRLREINSRQSPFPIVLIKYVEVSDARALEKELHQQFAKYRNHNEWFVLEERQVKEVMKAMDKQASDFNPIKLIIGLFILLQISVFFHQCQQPRSTVKYEQQQQAR